MFTMFDFVEKASGRTFHAQKVIQTDGTFAYAIYWTEGEIFKVELYSIKEVELAIKLESWKVIE